jgi:hypothetical protein
MYYPCYRLMRQLSGGIIIREVRSHEGVPALVLLNEGTRYSGPLPHNEPKRHLLTQLTGL